MEKIKTLFLSANPMGTSQLKLDEEIRSIAEKIRSAEHRDMIDLVSAWAVRPDDLLQLFNQHRPHIVHFSGHGNVSGEILLTSTTGQPRPVSANALRALFRTLKDNVHLVILNACYSRTQAESIAEEIDCVIGMSGTIGDNAAITFAGSFYRALGYGRSIENAFEQGMTSLLLEGIPEEKVPMLLSRNEVDPSQVFILERASIQDSKQELESQSGVKIVDVTIDSSGEEFPEIDIKLRNIGNEVAFLYKAEFDVLETGIIRETAMLSAEKASWAYDVDLSPSPEPYRKSVNISQSIKPNEVDRFRFVIGTEYWNYFEREIWLYMRVVLFYNESRQKVATDYILVNIAIPKRIAGAQLGGVSAEVYHHNSMTISRMLELPGVKSDPIADIAYEIEKHVMAKERMANLSPEEVFEIELNELINDNQIDVAIAKYRERTSCDTAEARRYVLAQAAIPSEKRFEIELRELLEQGKIISAIIKYQNENVCSLEEARKYIEKLNKIELG